MSTCGFCGDKQVSGRTYLAHRMTSTRIRTVKVCRACVDDARDAGYFVSPGNPPALAGRSAGPVR